MMDIKRSARGSLTLPCFQCWAGNHCIMTCTKMSIVRSISAVVTSTCVTARMESRPVLITSTWGSFVAATSAGAFLPGVWNRTILASGGNADSSTPFAPRPIKMPILFGPVVALMTGKGMTMARLVGFRGLVMMG